MRISLRTKAVLLMLVTLACTAGPLMHMSLQHSQESIKTTCEMAMTDILNLAEYAIKNNFNEVLHIKAIAIEGEKKVLENNTRSAVGVLQLLRAAGWSRERCAAALQKLNSDGQIVVMQRDGNAWDGPPTELFAELTANPDKKNDLLETVAHLISNGAEEFIVYASEGSPLLVYIAPLLQENAVMLALISLTPSIDMIETTLNNLRQNLTDALDTLHTFGEEGGVIALPTDPLRTTELNETPFSPEALVLIDEALRQNRQALTVPSENGPLLCRLKSMPLYHVAVVAAVPEEELNSSLHSLAVQQGTFFAMILLAGTLLTILFCRHLLAPLARFSRMASRLPHQDFTAEGSSETATLPASRNDEIGELARSFVDMEGMLRDTVRRLVSTATAKERLEGELNVAREIQEGILPKIFPPFPSCPELGMFASLLAAREMGGDLYDFFFVDDDNLCVAVGDVSGKGVPAALFMSITVTLLRTSMRPGVSPEQGIAALNTALASNNPQDMFVSLLLGLYNIRTGELRFAVGGHPLPIRITQTGCAPLPCAAPDLVLGLFPDIPYTGHVTQLRPGEALFLYTDGVTEATSASGEFYDESRLMQTLAACGNLSEEASIAAVTADMALFVAEAPQADDITMLILRRTAGNGDNT